MQALQYWKTVTVDNSNLLEHLFYILQEQQVRFCVIGGQAVNAYVEPLVSLDLYLVIAADMLPSIASLFGKEYRVQEFPHSINVSAENSDLRVQFQTGPRYADVIERAVPQNVLGLMLPVAAIEDVLQGKIWAVSDTTRRASKRQKDLADITRILETYPDLRSRVPTTILSRLL